MTFSQFLSFFPPGVTTSNNNTAKGVTDTIQPIIDFLSPRKGQAISLKEIYDSVGDGCTYQAFSSRISNAVNKGLIVQLKRGFYSISANAPEVSAAKTSENPKKQELVDSLGESAAKIHKLIFKNPNIGVTAIHKKAKVSESVIRYHLTNLMRMRLVQKTGRGSYSAL